MTKLTSLVQAGLLAGIASLAFAISAQTPAAAPTATDKTAMEAAFTRADGNGDGKLSKEEAARMPAIAAKFDELDVNKDGFLSREEFAAGYMAAS